MPQPIRPMKFNLGDWCNLPLSERVRRTRDVLLQRWQAGDKVLAQQYHTQLTRESWGEDPTKSFSHRLIMMGCVCLDRLVTNQPRPSVWKSVELTEIPALPRVPPRLRALQVPCVIEARQPEKGERLFGDTVALATFGDEVDGVDVWLAVRWLPKGPAKALSFASRSLDYSHNNLCRQMLGYSEWTQKSGDCIHFL